MSHLIVHGGRPLRGTVSPSANKNAVLPVLCATLLTSEPVRPAPRARHHRREERSSPSSASSARPSTWTSRPARSTAPPRHRFDAGRTACPRRCARRSCWCRRCWRASAPPALEDDVKGCTLGAREIDPHVDVFLAFGAEVERAARPLLVRSHRRLMATDHWPDYASVTTTENFVLCAALARGRSHADQRRLASRTCRSSATSSSRWARASTGIGSSRLKIDGVDALGGAEYTFADDFHEIATFLALGAITGGRRRRAQRRAGELPAARPHLRQVRRRDHPRRRRLAAAPRRAGPLKVRDAFTAQRAAEGRGGALALRAGRPAADLRRARRARRRQTLFWNKVYEGALGWTRRAGQVRRAGRARRDPHRLVVCGGAPLTPATVESPYIIRVAIALLMVAASIEGRSEIRDAPPIRRAHPRFAENLNALGAAVAWAEDESIDQLPGHGGARAILGRMTSRERRLAAIDVKPGAAMESQSGLQMLRPRIYGAYARPAGRRGERAHGAIVMHPTSNFMGHYLIAPARRARHRLHGPQLALHGQRHGAADGARHPGPGRRREVPARALGYEQRRAGRQLGRRRAGELLPGRRPSAHGRTIGRRRPDAASSPPTCRRSTASRCAPRTRAARSLLLRWIDPSRGRRARPALGRPRAGHVRPGATAPTPSGTTASYSRASSRASRRRSAPARPHRGARARIASPSCAPRRAAPRDEAFIVYRTHADPRCLDLSLDANDRATGQRLGRRARGQLRGQRDGPHDLAHRLPVAVVVGARAPAGRRTWRAPRCRCCCYLHRRPDHLPEHARRLARGRRHAHPQCRHRRRRPLPRRPSRPAGCGLPTRSRRSRSRYNARA